LDLIKQESKTLVLYFPPPQDFIWSQIYPWIVIMDCSIHWFWGIQMWL